MHKLSAIIPCKNERLNIRDCIESVIDLADETIVADNGSTDGTLEIVASYPTCRLIQRDFIGYANFKNWAMSQASHDWILILDADERITPKLADEIRQLLSGEPSCDSYRVVRDNYFLGRRIRYCGWGTHKITRLFRKSVCRYNNRRVHEEVDVDSGRVGLLSNRLVHLTARDFESFMVKQLKYASLNGLDRFELGKRPSFLRTLIHAPIRFFYLYVVRKGFLDGHPGLLVCTALAFYSFSKDARIYELARCETAVEPGLSPSSPEPILQLPANVPRVPQGERNANKAA